MKLPFNEALALASPCLLIVSGPEAMLAHITYKPSLRWGHYRIIRSLKHDGTLIFESELIAKTLLPVLNKQSCHKNDEGKSYADIRYEVGPVIITEKPCSFGSVRHGVEQTAKMWVRAFPIVTHHTEDKP